MRVYAIIVTFNPDTQLLKKQYQSISSQVDGIIYIDNSSNNISDISSIISHDFSKQVLIRNQKNAGLAKAQNQGIIKAIELGADYILLFDQDSIPNEDFVRGLIAIYKKYNHIKIGLVGPTFLNKSDGKLSNGQTLKGISVHNTPVNNEYNSVSFCIASGSLIPKEVIEDVGLMREDLFIDSLDLEWCLRAKSKGYDIVMTSNTSMIHSIGEGANNKIESHSSFREYYICRNSIILIKLAHIPFGYKVRKIFTVPARLLLSLSRFKFNYVVAQWRGICDGIKVIFSKQNT